MLGGAWGKTYVPRAGWGRSEGPDDKTLTVRGGKVALAEWTLRWLCWPLSFWPPVLAHARGAGEPGAAFLVRGRFTAAASCTVHRARALACYRTLEAFFCQ